MPGSFFNDWWKSSSLQEDIKSLTAHVIENYWKALEDVDYVQTFKGLKLRYDQQRERQDNPKLDRFVTTQHPSIHVRGIVKCLSVWQLCIQIRYVFSWYFGLQLVDLIITTSMHVTAQYSVFVAPKPRLTLAWQIQESGCGIGKSSLFCLLKDPHRGA